MKSKRSFVLIIIGILLVSGCALPSYAAKKGEKTFGVHAGYVSRNRSADVGLFFQYSFSRYFRLQPSADLIFRHQDRDAFTFDLNAQIPIDLGKESFSLYPFAGLNFSSWNHHFGDIFIEGENPVDHWVDYIPAHTDRSNYFGVNVGAGFDLKISSTMKISIEAGYTFVQSNSGVKILAGIGYVF